MRRHAVFNPAAGIRALGTRAGGNAARRARLSGGRGVNVSVGGTGAEGRESKAVLELTKVNWASAEEQKADSDQEEWWSNLHLGPFHTEYRSKTRARHVWRLQAAK